MKIFSFLIFLMGVSISHANFWSEGGTVARKFVGVVTQMPKRMVHDLVTHQASGKLLQEKYMKVLFSNSPLEQREYLEKSISLHKGQEADLLTHGAFIPPDDKVMVPGDEVVNGLMLEEMFQNLNCLTAPFHGIGWTHKKHPAFLDKVLPLEIATAENIGASFLKKDGYEPESLDPMLYYVRIPEGAVTRESLVCYGEKSDSPLVQNQCGFLFSHISTFEAFPLGVIGFQDVHQHHVGDYFTDSLMVLMGKKGLIESWSGKRFTDFFRL